MCDNKYEISMKDRTDRHLQNTIEYYTARIAYGQNALIAASKEQKERAEYAKLKTPTTPGWYWCDNDFTYYWNGSYWHEGQKAYYPMPEGVKPARNPDGSFRPALEPSSCPH